VTNGAVLSSNTVGQGNAGDVSITVRDAAIFSGVDSNGNPSFAGSAVIFGAVGNGGSLTVSVGSLNVSNGAGLSSSTFGRGDGGNVYITVRDAARFDGVGSNGSRSGAGSQVGLNAVGKGGNLTLVAGSLSVTNGAALSSNTFGRGDGGNVSITVRDVASFDGGGRNGFSTFAGSAVGANTTGKGGDLTLSAGSLNVTNGAALTSSTFGQGNAGDVSITVRDLARFDGVGRTGSSSGAGSIVGANATGKGGNLTLAASSLSVTNGAQLSSSTFGIMN
jgi:large exoprotein involved in heme utilization and adhesion